MPRPRGVTSNGSVASNNISRIGDCFNLTQQYSQDPHFPHKDDGAIMYFVLPKGMTEATCSQNMSMAYQLCLVHHICARWLIEEDCMKAAPVARNLFVLELFEGKCYEYLLGLYDRIKIEIVGPQCVRMALSKHEIVIRSTEYPMFTLAMQNIVVTMTGFENNKKEKAELQDLIQKMNGVVTPTFTMGTTHIVAMSVHTDKCRLAYERCKPVMTTEWIRTAWVDSQRELVLATDPVYVKFWCPIFHNMCICVSQVPSVKKNTLKSIIEGNGGLYYTELTKGTVKVLVIPTPNGEKYRYATQWGIPCVTPSWIENCKAAGHILPFNDFIVIATQSSKKMVTSTPEKHKELLVHNGTLMDTCSILPNVSRCEVEETFASVKNDSVISNVDTNALNIVKRASNEGLFLDGCKIYLCGSDTMEDIRKILNATGATRLNRLTENVTHVLVVGGKIPEDDIAKINCLNSKPHVVKIEWLFESARKGCPADEEIFAFVSGKPLAGKTNSNIVGEPLQNEDISMREALDLVAAHQQENDETPQRNIKSSEKRVSEVSRNSDETNCATPFAGIQFTVKLDVSTDNSLIKELITEMGGEIVNTGAEILILPVVYSRDMCYTNTRICSKFWVMECYDAKDINIPMTRLHVPQPSFKGMRNILKSVVIAVSQYANSEKSYLATVAISMGAEYQDVFARKTTKAAQQSTHLICSVAENDKCEAAKRWGVPVVTAEWIYDCFAKKRMLPVKEYSPGAKQNDSDSTISYMPITPKPMNSTTLNRAAQRLTALTSTTAIYPPSTSKKPQRFPNIPSTFKRPAVGTPTSSQSPSDADSQTPVAHRVNQIDDDSFSYVPPSKPLEESPIIRGFSREGSRQLKRYLDNACSRSPGPDLSHLTIKIPPKTPDSVVMGRVWDALKKKFPRPPVTHDQVPKDQIPIETAPEVLIKPNIGKHDDSGSSNEENIMPKRRKEGDVGETLLQHQQIDLEKMDDLDCDHDITTGELCTTNRNGVNSRSGSNSIDSLEDSGGVRGLMKNFLIAISKKCEGVEKLNSAIQHLGGTVTGDFSSPELTHLVYQGKNAPMSKELKSTTNQDVKIVDPTWVFNCVEKNVILDEDMYYPGRVKISTTKEITLDKDGKSSKKSLDALENLLSIQDDHAPNNIEIYESTQGRTIKYQKAKTDTIESDSDMDDGHAGGSRKKTVNDDVVKHNEAVKIVNEEVVLEEQICASSKISELKKNGEKPASTEKHSYIQQLKETTPQEKALDKLKETTNVNPGSTSRVGRVTRSKSAVHNTALSWSSKNNPKAVISKIGLVWKANPIFMLSGLQDNIKQCHVETIERLGGSVSEGSYYDPKADAIISGSLARSEKILSSVAAGKPLLMPSYMDACNEKNNFVSPTNFFWRRQDTSSEIEVRLAVAAEYWRNRISQNAQDKPFTNMRIFLVASKVDNLTRLIVSGGGTVVRNIEEATLRLGDAKELKEREVNIPTQSPSYLTTILFNTHDSQNK